MNKKQKQNLIADLKVVFSEASMVVVCQNKGVTADQAIKLRKNVRLANGETLVAKNTLAKIAIQNSEYQNLSESFKGTTLLMHSNDDPIAIAKVVTDFTKTHETLKVSTAAMGSNILNANELKSLAELPSLEELRAKIVGVIQAPASKIARVMSASGSQLARVINAYSEK